MSGTKFDVAEPCGNCPFRRDAPLAHWHPEEYDKLERMERVEGIPGSSTLFACHKTRTKETQSACAGWLLDQRRKNTPSFALRLAVTMNAEAGELYAALPSDGSPECYSSVEELVRENRRADAIMRASRGGRR